MPPRPPTAPTLPTSIFSLPMTRRDAIGLRRRQHVRRQISLPGLPDVSDLDIPELPGIAIGLGLDTDTEDEEETTDDEVAPAPAPPPPPAQAASLPATQPAALPSASVATPAPAVPAVPAAQTSGLALSSTVPAVPDSVPKSITIITTRFSMTSARGPLPTTSTDVESDGDNDDDDLPTSTVIINPVPPTPSLSTSTIATSTPRDGRPAISPTNPALSYNDGPAPESKTAVTAAVTIICISLFFGIVYCLLRFCPPVRDRWTAFKLRRKHERQKRMGIDESPLPAPVVVVSGGGMGQQSTWATGGLGMRNIGIENGVVKPLDEAHLRPPSYRSHWTASGASWVANGFRLPERVSQRMMRWSDRSARSRFPGGGQRMGSDSESGGSFGGGGLVADGMGPPGMSEISRMSRTTSAGRLSTVSSMSGGSRPPGGSESGSRSTRVSRHSQAGFSTDARISDMSSLSAGTTTNAFRPPPLLRAPIGVARGSGSGLME